MSVIWMSDNTLMTVQFSRSAQLVSSINSFIKQTLIEFWLWTDTMLGTGDIKEVM